MNPSINYDRPRYLRLDRGHAPYGERFYCARWSADQRFLASCSVDYGDDSTLEVWDVATGRVAASRTFPRNAITSLAWSPDGQTLASCFADGGIRLWNPLTQKALGTVRAHHRHVSTLEWGANGDTILSSGDDATLLWNIHTTRIAHRFEAASGEGRLAASLCPDGEHIALGAPGEALRVVNLTTGKTEAVLEARLPFMPVLRWSPSGEHLLYTSEENVLRAWTMRAQRKSAFFSTAQPVSSVAWAPDEKGFAAVTSGDGSFPEECNLYLWDRTTTEVTFHREIRRVYALYSVDFAPDGRAVAVAGSDSLLAIWDLDGTHFPALWAHVPSPERREELATWVELNTAQGLPPYYEVRLLSRQEVQWIFQEHDWYSRHVEKPGVSPHPHAAQFAGADMHGLDLSGMAFNTGNFSGADLRGANLTSCTFEGANLSHARLDDAIVVDAAFSYASLVCTNFSGVAFKQTRFYETRLEVALLVRCRCDDDSLRSAKLWECDCSHADFSGADLHWAHFKDCVLIGAKFTHANLSNVTLEQCQVDDPDIFGAAITNEHTKISDLRVRA